MLTTNNYIYIWYNCVNLRQCLNVRPFRFDVSPFGARRKKYLLEQQTNHVLVGQECMEMVLLTLQQSARRRLYETYQDIAGYLQQLPTGSGRS